MQFINPTNSCFSFLFQESSQDIAEKQPASEGPQQRQPAEEWTSTVASSCDNITADSAITPLPGLQLQHPLQQLQLQQLLQTAPALPCLVYNFNILCRQRQPPQPSLPSLQPSLQPAQTATAVLNTFNSSALHLQQQCSTPSTAVLYTFNSSALHLQQQCSTPSTALLYNLNSIAQLPPTSEDSPAYTFSPAGSDNTAQPTPSAQPELQAANWSRQAASPFRTSQRVQWTRGPHIRAARAQQDVSSRTYSE